jgi:hypothetical protein
VNARKAIMVSYSEFSADGPKGMKLSLSLQEKEWISEDLLM